MQKINLQAAAAQVEGIWNPLVLAELNGQAIKLAKFHGAFDWHHHEREDEAFLVVQGEIVIEFRERRVALATGELLVVPRGVTHRPIAEKEALVLLFEPKSTLNTGNAVTANTRTVLQQVKLA